jgi:Na+/phosphate symporter
MKTRKFNALIIASVLFLAACGGGIQPENNEEAPSAIETALQEAMDVHDEVMPYMKHIKQAEKELQQILSENEGLGEEQIIAINEALDQLRTSHEEMMVWMRNFKKPALDADEEEATAYLFEQKTAMQEIGDRTLSAIENAKNIVAASNEDTTEAEK